MARKPRRDYTEEDVIKIKAHNKKVLDELFSDPHWRMKLGIKHYGRDNWQKAMFGEDHPDYWEWKQAKLNGTRDASSDKNTPIIQYTIGGTEIMRHENIAAVLEYMNWGENKKVNILECCRRNQDSAYKYKWKFDKDYE